MDLVVVSTILVIWITLLEGFMNNVWRRRYSTISIELLLLLWHLICIKVILRHCIVIREKCSSIRVLLIRAFPSLQHDLVYILLYLRCKQVSQSQVKVVFHGKLTSQIVRIVPFKYLDILLLPISNVNSDSQKFNRLLRWLSLSRLGSWQPLLLLTLILVIFLCEIVIVRGFYHLLIIKVLIFISYWLLIVRLLLLFVEDDRHSDLLNCGRCLRR